jgi:ribose transport system permease protein
MIGFTYVDPTHGFSVKGDFEDAANLIEAPRLGVRLSGVNVVRWKASVYVVCGLFAGLAGVVIAARLNSAQPSLGQGYELDAIAAAVIGGTSLSGGEGSILGTVIGAFIISTLTNGLRILSVPQEWQTVVTGGIVILAVYLDIVRRRRQQ